MQKGGMLLHKMCGVFSLNCMQHNKELSLLFYKRLLVSVKKDLVMLSVLMGVNVS